MRQTTEISHTLEISGPRNDAFRTALEDEFKEARRLAHDGNFSEAIRKAEDAYIEAHGNMHGVAFRVVTTQTTYSFNGPWEEGIHRL